MPTYEYTCEKCDCSFEWVQSMSSEPLKTCPKEVCGMKKKWGKGKVRRAIGTGAGLIFKGSGFYITDYRSEGYKEAAKKDSAGASASPAAAPASSESKSASSGSESGTATAKTAESKPAETKAAVKPAPAKKGGKKK